MAFVDPDEKGFIDPDGFQDPDEVKNRKTQSPADFFKESAVGNIMYGIPKMGDIFLRGLEAPAAAAAGAVGAEGLRDSLLAGGDDRSRTIGRWQEEQGGKSDAARFGQGIAPVIGAINPISAIPSAVGGVTDVQRTLDEQGVDPSTAAGAAWRQAGANMVTGALPFANISRLGGAAANVAGGFGADVWTRDYLREKGYSKVGDEMFNPYDPVNRALDVGGGFAAPPSKPKAKTPAKKVINNLDNIDKANQEKTQTQGEGTYYVGKDGAADTSLPSRTTEDPAVTEYARAQVQDRLTDTPPQKFSYWEPAQGELFDPISGPHYPDAKSAGQQSLDLRTDAGPLTKPNQVAPNQAGPEKDFGSFKTPAEAKPNLAELPPDGPQLHDYLTNWLKDYYQKQFDLRGKEFADDQKYVDAMKADPWAWVDIAPLYETFGIRTTDLGWSREYTSKPELSIDPEVRDIASRHHKALYESAYGTDERGLREKTIIYKNLDSYDPQTGRFDPNEVINILRQTHNEKIHLPYRQILDMFQSAINKMGDRKPFFEVSLDANKRINDVVPDPFEIREADGSIRQPGAAHYDPNVDIVRIGLRGASDRTFVHEFAHALTSRMLYMYGDNHPRTKPLYRLYEDVKSRPSYFTKEDGRTPMYGLKDIHEFVAEAFSNPDFLAQLAFFEPNKKSVVQKIIHRFSEAVLKALGFKAGDAQMRKYAEAMNDFFHHSEDLIKEYSDHKEMYDQIWKEWQRGDYDKKLSKLVPSNQDLTNLQKAKIQDPEAVRSNKAEELTGIKYVPKDPVVDDALLKKIAGEKDGSRVWFGTPGAHARAELNKSTLVMTGHRFLDNASKRTQYLITKLVEPAEKAVGNILRGDRGVILFDVLKRELRNKRDYTIDELRTAGLDDETIQAHREFRAMMQGALEAQNQALRDRGLPPITALDAYITSRWSGPWRAIITEDGRPVYVVREHSRREANRAVEYIKKNVANPAKLKFEDVKFIEGMEKGDSFEASYLDMLKFLDKDDPRVAALDSIYRDYVLSNTEDVANQEKHFLKKTGVRGAAGDRPWSNDDIKPFFIQQFAYAKNAMKWAQYQKAMDNMKPLLNNPEIQENQKNNLAYLKEYSKVHLGFGTLEEFRKLEAGLSKLTGLSPEHFQSGVGASKTLFYLSRLGLSAPFMVMQFVQPFMTVPAHMVSLAFDGHKFNPVTTGLNGVFKGGEAATWHYAKLLGEPVQFDKLMDDVDREAVKYMDVNQVIQINPLSDIKRNLRPEALKTVAKPFEFTIQFPEVYARSFAFMSFVDALKQSGKYDLKTHTGRMEMFQKAESLTRDAMTDYRPEEQAVVFERMGLVGDAARTLHAFQINNLYQLTKFSKMALKGNPLPLFTMVALQAAIGGALGLWFVEDLDDLIETIKQWLPHDAYMAKIPGTDMKVKDFSIRRFLVQNDLLAYGLASKVTGTNIHTRAGQGNIIPVWPFEQSGVSSQMGKMAPFAGVTAAVIEGGMTMANPAATQREKLEALYKAAPVVAQGPMENTPAFNAGNTALNPNDLRQGLRQRTDTEKMMRNVGLRSLEEQKEKDRQYALSKTERQIQDRMKKASTKAIDYAIAGNSEGFADKVIEYTDLGGDPQKLIQQIPKARMNQMLTELQRRATTASTKQGILRLQRALEMR